LSVVAGPAVPDRLLTTFDTAFDSELWTSAAGHGSQGPEGIVAWLCNSLCDAISARSVAVFDAASGHSSRLIRALGPGQDGSADLFPTLETMSGLVRQLRAGASIVVLTEIDDLEPAPYNAVPLRAGGEVLGLLLIAEGYIACSDWPLIAEYADGLSRYLWDEADRRRRERRLLDGQLALAREIHDTVIQDMFGIALMLDDPGEQRPSELRECASRIRGVQEQLRSILDRATHEGEEDNAESPTVPSLEAMLREQAQDAPLVLELDALATVPARTARLAGRCASEGLRNALRHADPTCISVSASLDSAVVRVCVSNDGVHERHGRRGIGLRLLELDARSLGGSITATHEEGTWQLVLTMPTPSNQI
jgi:signal transduction histidine kinase